VRDDPGREGREAHVARPTARLCNVRLGVYLADQVWDRTQSKGIYTYSRLLVRQLAKRLPEHELTLIVNRANRADMVPPGHPEPLVVSLSSASAAGLPRLLIDHVLGLRAARAHGLDLLHFPKGFVPLRPSARIRITATVHDTIPIYYERHYPGYFSRAKLRYFRAMLRHTLRSAHGLMTVSHFSRAALLDLARTWNLPMPAIDVCEEVPDPELTAVSEETETRRDPTRLLHLGSLFPHKRTRDTLGLFQRFNQRAGGGWRLHVTGLEAAPTMWGVEWGPEVHFLGTLSGAALRDELRQARALLLLSSIEGFGLPALEAWFLGTPVCYAAAGSLPEILAGLPGRCDPVDDPSFDAALHEVLTLDDRQRRTVRDGLRQRFDLDAYGERVAALFRRWLGADLNGPRPRLQA
jgi:glycosyltransferase involved in cell wall biosynthesis